MAKQKDWQSKTKPEIQAEILKSRREFVEKNIEFKMGKLKSGKVLSNIKKELARMLTVVNSKKESNAK